jgi:transposase
MYMATIPNRQSPPALLLRESYRVGKKVRNRTLANLSDWPKEKIEALRHVLKGTGTVTPPLQEAFEIVRSRPHGHVAAVLGVANRLHLAALIDPKDSPSRRLCMALVVARLLDPCSKLATARSLDPETGHSTLFEQLRLEAVDEDDLYTASDFLAERQATIEEKLAERHLGEGTLVLYDVSSSYYTGRHCPLAQFGHDRDGKGKFPQIIYGLLCNSQGCPVAVEVFEGNIGDPKTLKSQIVKVRERFHLRRVVWVGDRGILTEARIEEELRGVEGLDWITALRAPVIRALVEQGAIQMSLFDRKDLVEIASADYPGERLIVCLNPVLREDRRRTREELLGATEKELDVIVAATRRAKRALRGQDRIGLRVGKVLNRHKVGKHFVLSITEESFSYRRDDPKIEQEALLDGLYVIRTSVPRTTLPAESVVLRYKDLCKVERAFRSLKTVDLHVRPIFHRLEKRVRAHVFLCTLAYYVEWHMRRDLAPLLFDDEDRAQAEQDRTSPVTPAKRSDRAEQKARTLRTEEGWPVHSFQTLLKDLATIVKNRVVPKIEGAPAFDKITTPTALQDRAFKLLRVSYRM